MNQRVDTRGAAHRASLRHSGLNHLLFQFQLRRPGATLHDLEIALDPIGAELVRMRTVAAPGEHSVLVDRIVELRVVREKDGRTGRGGLRGHVLLRVDIGLEILDARIRRVVHEIERRAARIRHVDRPAAVQHREGVGQRARRMAGSEPDGHGRLAERDLHAVGGDDVALRRHRLVPVRILRNQIPVGPAHDDARAVPSLQHLGAADVVAMGVGDDDILDVLRIEAELLHPADDQFLGVVGKDRVEEDDPVARRQRPGRVELAADEVEIVEDLGGLGVPGVTRRRAGGVRDVARHVVAGVFAAALRQQARSDQGAEELEAGRSLGRLQRSLDLRLEVLLTGACCANIR